MYFRGFGGIKSIIVAPNPQVCLTALKYYSKRFSGLECTECTKSTNLPQLLFLVGQCSEMLTTLEGWVAECALNAPNPQICLSCCFWWANTLQCTLF